MAFGEDSFGFKAATKLLEQVNNLYPGLFDGYTPETFYQGLRNMSGIDAKGDLFTAVRAHKIKGGPEDGKLTLVLRLGYEEVKGKMVPEWMVDSNIHPVDYANLVRPYPDLATAVNAVYPYR